MYYYYPHMRNEVVFEREGFLALATLERAVVTVQ